MQISKNLILNGVTGGSFGLGAVVFLASLFAFNGETFYKDDQIGIQFGMAIDAAEQEISVWMHVPSALFIKSKIRNVIKFDGEGGQEDATLVALFPVSDSTSGAGTVEFEIFTANEEVMPDLVNRDQTLVPMVYILNESKFPTFLRYILIMGAVSLNNWAVVKLGILGSAFALIALGAGLLVLNLKSNNNQVVEIKDDIKDE